MKKAIQKDRERQERAGKNRRSFRVKTAGICLMAGLLLMAGAGSAAADETEDGLLIEDDGEEVVDQSGASLEELQAQEAAAETPQTEAPQILTDEDPTLERASADMLQLYLDGLTGMASPIGSDGELEIGQYIKSAMENMGYEISEQNFHEGFLNANGVDAPGINIIAERGADAENRHSDILIISTHYDSKSFPEEGDPFSNDKTGAAVLLEMVRILSGVETDTDICFLFLSGEEDGLYGSANFVRTLGEEYNGRIAGVIDVERVGYTGDFRYVLKTVDQKENTLGNLLREEAASYGLADADTPEAIGLQADPGVAGNDLESHAEGNAAGQDETKAQNWWDWQYLADEAATQKSFADAGIMAVTVSQDTAEAENNAEENAGDELKTPDEMSEETDSATADSEATGNAEEVKPEITRLQQITDILASVVARIMSEKTGSLLY